MNRSALDTLFSLGHEQVVIRHDPASGYRGIVAIHSTVLGPAVGGTRRWRYDSADEALADALRLSRGMTYKNAAAGLPFGGGKAVILATPEGLRDREALYRSHGRFVDGFQGRFITAEDVGTTAQDCAVTARETRHVVGFSGRGGDPSPWTALGVHRGIQASALYRWGTEELRGRTVAIQGCGSVGTRLARRLAEAGARLVVADADAARAEACARETGAATVGPDEILAVSADVFAPCALGGVINDATVPRFQAEIVAGAANNQLVEDRHADDLAARGILYAPDYIINAGGVISGSVALAGVQPGDLEPRVSAIYDTLLEVYRMAERDGLTTAAAADRFAEARLKAG